MGACGDLSYQGTWWSRRWKSIRWSWALVGWTVWDARRCATGTIVNCSRKADGDVHINLDVSRDPTSQALLNAANPPNILVCEIVLADRPRFLAVLDMLAPGQQVQICGRWCRDNRHGWNELHPVASLTFTTGVPPQPLPAPPRPPEGPPPRGTLVS
jgi:hypothetical protein